MTALVLKLTKKDERPRTLAFSARPLQSRALVTWLPRRGTGEAYQRRCRRKLVSGIAEIGGYIMNVGSLVIYDDGKLLHTAQVMRLEETQATIRIFRTARPDRVVTVSRQQLSLVHEQEKPA